MAERSYIGLGSNMGDRESHLRSAREQIGGLDGVSMLRSSTVLETAPVGVEDQPPFLNAVAEVSTTLSPHELLRHLQAIEHRLGRTRGRRWGPRTIDLDLLFHGSNVLLTPDLELPHPRLAEREFVLRSMAELNPEFLHPTEHKTIRQLLDAITAGVV